jgi:hypothetical protein
MTPTLQRLLSRALRLYFREDPLKRKLTEGERDKERKKVEGLLCKKAFFVCLTRQVSG